MGWRFVSDYTIHHILNVYNSMYASPQLWTNH